MSPGDSGPRAQRFPRFSVRCGGCPTDAAFPRIWRPGGVASVPRARWPPKGVAGAWPGRGRCPAAPQPRPGRGAGAGAGAAVGAAAARDVRRQEEEEAGAQEVGAARGLPPVTPGRASESRATGAQLVLGKRLESL